MKQILTVIILALLTITPVRGEVLAKKKIVEPVADSLTIFIQAGDSCMQQFNTFEATFRLTSLRRCLRISRMRLLSV